ncbi:sensor histidine kinase [Streptomyces sp. NPDC101455]|uniref:sensor histidine kinase n=1 Tax=Streptomyces sp. NPDC101455 TaxID=3366142 RepID=UPI00380A1B42
MTVPAAWRQAARAHPLVVDGALAVVWYLAALLLPFVPGDPPRRVPLTATFAVLGALVWGLLVFRRRRPVTVLAVSMGVVCVSMIIWGVQLAFLVPPVVAAYTVALHTGRRIAWTAGAVAAVVFSVTMYSTQGGGWWSHPQTQPLVLWIGMAVAAGDAIRTRRAYVVLLEERARRAEQSREEESARRVTEERLRIARELHDVAAHHIAVISVQAGVAGHTLRTDPEVAEESLALVRQASRTVLEELSTLLGVLRRDDDPRAPVEPTRGLDGLGNLVDSFAAAGLEVAWTLSGHERPLPSAVDLAAYRIVQESLTNVHKHSGSSSATVDVKYLPDRLVVRILDDGAGAMTVRTDSVVGGHGILGMRERANAVGGRFEASPGPGGGFTVRAVLPLPPPPARGRRPMKDPDKEKTDAHPGLAC